MNFLFVCSKNKWRSRTAETIFRDLAEHEVQSAGTSDGARIKLNEKHLAWADLVFVMETKHQKIIQQKFKSADYNEKIIVLDIPDDYQYMDETLIAILEAEMATYIN